MITETDPIASAPVSTGHEPQTTNNEQLYTTNNEQLYAEQSAAIHAKWLADLPRADLEQAIAWLLLHSSLNAQLSTVSDIDWAAYRARIASLEA